LTAIDFKMRISSVRPAGIIFDKAIRNGSLASSKSSRYKWSKYKRAGKPPYQARNDSPCHLQDSPCHLQDSPCHLQPDISFPSGNRYCSARWSVVACLRLGSLLWHGNQASAIGEGQ